MRFATPISFPIYFGIDTKAQPGDETFGLAIGRFYVGFYGPRSIPGNPYGWAAGILDQHGCL